MIHPANEQLPQFFISIIIRTRYFGVGGHGMMISVGVGLLLVWGCILDTLHLK